MTARALSPLRTPARLGPEAFPWDPTRRLVFHQLLTLPRGRRGAVRLRALAAAGARLAPPAQPAHRWGARRRTTLLGALDEAAGDDRYLFFSIGREYHGSMIEETPAERRVAVAYDLETLLATGRVGWRPMDLIGWYRAVVESLERTHRRPTAAQVAAALRAFADCMTVWEPPLVRALAALELRRIALGLRGQKALLRDARALLARRDRTCVAAQPVLIRGPHLPDPVELPTLFEEPFRVLASDREDAWAPFPQSISAAGRPEVVCDGTLPLAAVAYYRDAGTGRWHEGPPKPE